MAKLSRVEKHKNQTDDVIEDVGQDIESDELLKFQDRLNQIDSDNFAAPKRRTGRAADYDPIHGRRAEALEETGEPKQEDDESIPDDDEFNMTFNNIAVNPEEEAPKNDYLNRYLNEVKQYNIDQGNAVSDNTSVNILKNITPKKTKEEAPATPYPSRRRHAGNTSSRARSSTAEVPFINANVTPSSYRHADRETTEDLSADKIASRVQNMASEPDDDFAEETETKRRPSGNTDEFTKQLEMERTTNQQLLDQTTQMQARMDDVGENLNDVTNRMRHTNQILNIVLVVVIVALVIVLGILIYWIVLSGGTK